MSPYSISNISQYFLNSRLFNALALILSTRFTTGYITCHKVEVFPQSDSWCIMQRYFRRGRLKKFSSNVVVPATWPIIYRAPSVNTLTTLQESICNFFRHYFTLSNMSNTFVFPWSDSRLRRFSKTLKLSPIPRVNMHNWATSTMSVDTSNANKKNVQVLTRPYNCWDTTSESSSVRLGTICFPFDTFITKTSCK